MWNTLQKEEELPEWAILLPSVQDIQDWRPKSTSRIFGNQDWKETRWDTRMNSANPDIANFEKSQVRRRGAQRRTKHPIIKYHHWREEVRKGIISISTYHTGTKWKIALPRPFDKCLRKKIMKDWDQDRHWTEYIITLKWGSVSIRTYSERSQRSTQEPKRDPSWPEGTARTSQATDQRPTVRSQTPALRWEHHKRQRSKLSATRAHDHWGYHAFRTLEVRMTE